MTDIPMNEIPGMVEPIEQVTLETVAKSVELSKGEVIVEFGPFFGKSTASLATGLAKNQTRSLENHIYTYDSFKCSKAGSFYSAVKKITNAHNLNHLLEEDDSFSDFLPVFKHYLGDQIASGVVVPRVYSLADSYHTGETIAVLHIDSPKLYSELEFITRRFFEFLRVGSVIIFQDYFLHWSGTLIAAINSMVRLGFIEVFGTAASSLLCVVKKDFNPNDFLTFEALMNDASEVSKAIDATPELLAGKEIDRRERFLPRISLAKIQWLYETGDAPAAAKLFASFVQTKDWNLYVLPDFYDLMSHKFVYPSGYETEHPEP